MDIVIILNKVVSKISIVKIQQTLFCFIVYSVIGWILESTLKTFVSRKFISSGFLYGPLCPIYGFGALIMIIFLMRFKDNPVALFMASFIILSVWEYIVGLYLEYTFHTTYWDYSQNRFNIQGRVCLQNSIYWGILGVLFVYYIHPFVLSKVQLISNKLLTTINIIIYTTLFIDIAYSVYKTIGLNKQFRILEELTENTKLKLTELALLVKANNIEAKQEKIEELKNIIKDLKTKELKIKIKLATRTQKLKDAFPGIKSDKITKFLKEQKNDLKTLKQKLRKKENKG